MTLPCERTLAVLWAREFLVRLGSPHMPEGIKGIRCEVRQEARDILRHFPSAFELESPSESLDSETAKRWHKKSGQTLVELMVALAIIATMFAIFCSSLGGCGKTDGLLRTVSHEGHWFVADVSLRPSHFIHHPSCPCTINPESEEMPHE